MSGVLGAWPFRRCAPSEPTPLRFQSVSPNSRPYPGVVPPLLHSVSLNSGFGSPRGAPDHFQNARESWNFCFGAFSEFGFLFLRFQNGLHDGGGARNPAVERLGHRVAFGSAPLLEFQRAPSTLLAFETRARFRLEVQRFGDDDFRAFGRKVFPRNEEAFFFFAGHTLLFLLVVDRVRGFKCSVLLSCNQAYFSVRAAKFYLDAEGLGWTTGSGVKAGSLFLRLSNHPGSGSPKTQEAATGVPRKLLPGQPHPAPGTPTPRPPSPPRRI